MSLGWPELFTFTKPAKNVRMFRAVSLGKLVGQGLSLGSVFSSESTEEQVLIKSYGKKTILERRKF